MTTTSHPLATSTMRARIPHYRALLSTFTTSPSTFEILHSIPSPSTSTSTSPLPKTLLTLDSSFNPPTLAHAHLLHTALSLPTHPPTRILLLLATTNADKAPKPASFEERLCMMEIFASELLSQLTNTRPTSNAKEKQTGTEIGGIDIAVTKHPYFVNKSTSISAHPSYTQSAQQIHLIGFDTLTRLLDPKYYPPSHTLSAVSSFLAHHKLLVTYRLHDAWGTREEQDAYVKRIGEGALDGVGGRREWVGEGRIRMVEGAREVVSSTRVRDACRRGDGAALKGLVTEGVAEWVLGERLYLGDA
ncbi:Nicotinamide mononucleotide adenylyltransferase [Lachnellula arida]|uniref:Nicotinamide mononucleotide adenylyltransferase n=1 Tax=Lachnellula arida TaxID=1316785 RepID=A0A8T9BD62_9HELO|nr:Nicotinamide mononucleotide adenylyltransferase [Lachnellula arida]